MRNDKRSIAYHEAGHAVLHLLAGHEIESATIAGDDDAKGRVVCDVSGLEVLRYEDDDVRQVPFERQIMACMAGVIAQRQFAPQSATADDSEFDHSVAHEWFDALEVPRGEIRDAYWHLLELRTGALVKEHWGRVERIAAALLEHETLTGAQVEQSFRASS
jgi:ATP-dependent Zn protease